MLLKLDYRAVPLILVLGPLLERSIRRTVIQSQGDLLVFVERPIAPVLLLATVMVLIVPLFLSLIRRRRIAADEAGT